MRAILGNAFIAIKDYQMKVAPLWRNTETDLCGK